MEHKNITSQDAFQRVLYAKMGSLANASSDYLLALQRELHVWLGQVDRALLTLIVKERQARENREEEGEESLVNS